MQKKNTRLFVIISIVSVLIFFLVTSAIYVFVVGSTDTRSQDIDTQFEITLLGENFELNYFDDGEIRTSRSNPVENDCPGAEILNLSRGVGQVSKDNIEIVAFSRSCEGAPLSRVNGQISLPSGPSEIVRLKDGEVLEEFNTDLGNGYWYKETQTTCTNSCEDSAVYSSIVVLENGDQDFVVLATEFDNRGLSKKVLGSITGATQ